MTPEEKLKIEERIVEVLKTVYDPEIPVDIYNLGLIYRIELQEDGLLDVDRTRTAPDCPAADFMVEDVRLSLMGENARVDWHGVMPGLFIGADALEDPIRQACKEN